MTYSACEYHVMKLDAYIRSNDVTEMKIAELAGCSQSTVNKVRNGLGNPTFALLIRISKATNGEFQPADFEPKSAQAGEAAA